MMDLEQEIIDCVIATATASVELAAAFPDGDVRIEDISPGVDLHAYGKWPLISIAETEEYQPDGDDDDDLVSDDCTERRLTWVMVDIWDRHGNKKRCRKITDRFIEAMSDPVAMAGHNFSMRIHSRRALRDPNPRVHRQRVRFRFITQPK